MKYTIRGLTNATLTINSLKLTVRGNSKNIKYYPNSIFYNVEVSSPQQLNELKNLASMGYLSFDLSEKSTINNEPKPIQKNKPEIKTEQVNLSGSEKENSTEIKKAPQAIIKKHASAEEVNDTNDSIVMVGGIPQKAKTITSQMMKNMPDKASLDAEKELLEQENEDAKNQPPSSIIWVESGIGEAEKAGKKTPAPKKIKKTSKKLESQKETECYDPKTLKDIAELDDLLE